MSIKSPIEASLEEIHGLFRDNFSGRLPDYIPELAKIGVEPTGDAFNSISLDPRTGRPMNPMINAGAIASTGLVQGTSVERRFERILQMFQNYAGRPLSLDEQVYRSESETGHRNRAIGHMLAQLQHPRGRPQPGARPLFPPVLDRRDLPRPGRDGGDPGQHGA